jgi:hypothetical protein
MNNYKKYIKYKTKYLKLKKNLNNTQVGGHKVKTISNSGSREGMSLQCFWISILDYLHRNGHNNLTLRELREYAGLDRRTEHTMFDIDDLVGSSLDRQAIFYNAAVQVAELYNLTIQVFTVNYNGNIIYSDVAQEGIRATIGNGQNRVNIAQFGLGHFELIVDEGGGGEDFVPLISVMGVSTKITKIPKERQNIYLRNSEDTLLLKDLEHQLKKLSEENKKKQQALRDDQSFIEYTTKYSDLETLIREIKERIKKEELEIKGFIVLDKIDELDEFKKLKENITVLQQQRLEFLRHQQSALQSSLKGEKTEAIASVLAQIDENFSKEIEIFKLEDRLKEQEIYVRDEQERYNMLLKLSNKQELQPLEIRIQKIKDEIIKTKENIATKKRELGI